MVLASSITAVQASGARYGCRGRLGSLVRRATFPRPVERCILEAMTISFSRYLALVLGLVTPVAETIRRWSPWRADPPALFDDYILGALLLYGAWRVGRDARTGQRFLAAGFAFMCGMAYYSFFGQLQNIRS